MLKQTLHVAYVAFTKHTESGRTSDMLRSVAVGACALGAVSGALGQFDYAYEVLYSSGMTVPGDADTTVLGFRNSCYADDGSIFTISDVERPGGVTASALYRITPSGVWQRYAMTGEPAAGNFGTYDLIRSVSPIGGDVVGVSGNIGDRVALWILTPSTGELSAVARSSILVDGIGLDAVRREFAANDGRIFFGAAPYDGAAFVAGAYVNSLGQPLTLTAERGGITPEVRANSSGVMVFDFPESGRVYSGPPESVVVVAEINQSSPIPSVRYAFTSDPTINGAGEISFLAELRNGDVTPSNDRAIITGLPGAFELTLREGDAVPANPGLVFNDFDSTQITESGGVVALASVRGPGVTAANDDVIVKVTDEGVELVVREGDVLAGASTPCGTLTLNGVSADDRVLFTASLGGNQFLLDGMWRTDETGQPRSVLIRGNTIDIDPDPAVEMLAEVTGFSTNSYDSTGEDGLPDSVRDDGSLIASVLVADLGDPSITSLLLVRCDTDRIETCASDFDLDGDVDLGDFGFFGGAFGSVLGDANYSADADFDSDGDVDLGDFGVFGSLFGRTDCFDN